MVTGRRGTGHGGTGGRPGRDTPLLGRRRPDRGQVLLAGCVLLAVAVLGVAALLDAAMYAGGTTAGEHHTGSLESARTYERLAGSDLRRLVEETDDEAAFLANATTYADRLAVVAGHSDAAVLDLRLAAASPSDYRFEFSYVTPSLAYRTTISIPRPSP